MLDREALDRVDDLARYLPDTEYEPRSAVASGYQISDLYRGHILDEEHMRRLEKVAELVRDQGRLIENEELLDAWLSTFELLASIRPEEFPDHTPPAETKEGSSRDRNASS